MSRSQANEKTSTLLDCAISAKPTIVSHPPTYIGLRTARYGPKATNARGGSNGAGVPLPRMAKSAMHVSASGTPAMRTATPSGHVHDGSGPPKIASNCLAHSPTMAHSQTNTVANAMVRIAANGTVMRSPPDPTRSEEHTSELQSRSDLVCRLLLEKKKKKNDSMMSDSE